MLELKIRNAIFLVSAYIPERFAIALADSLSRAPGPMATSAGTTPPGWTTLELAGLISNYFIRYHFMASFEHGGAATE